MNKIDISKNINAHIDEVAKSKGMTSDSLDLQTCDLIDTNILDSLGVLQLIVLLEKTFNIRILPAEMVIDNFRTAELISKFIQEKTNTI